MRLRDIRHTEEQIIAAKRAEIANRYDQQAKRASRGPVTFAAIRAAELAKLYQARYGREVPADDIGLTAARIMAHHLARLRDAPRRISAWLDRHAPWIELPEAERLIREATDRPLKWKADKLAWKLRVTAAERAELNIRTIGAIDQPKADRDRIAKDRRRMRQQARRRNEGAKPRDQYEGQSLAKRKPWKAAGLSRAQWYRAGKPSAPQ